MAFRAPTNHRHLSIQSIPHLQDDDLEPSYSPLLSSPGVRSPTVEQDADEWVVFSPSPTTATGTNPLSRISEIGSVQSAPRILRHGGNFGIPGTFDDMVGDEEEEDDEDDDDDDDYLDGTETDLLQPFCEQDNEGPVMLPTHDGLGTFPSSSGVISGLRSLEESLRIAAMHGHTQAEEDTDAKIQRWRVEHSQALLDEIQRMTRRNMSLASLRGGNLEGKDRHLDEESACMGTGDSSVEDLTSTSTPTQSHAEGMEQEIEHSETLWMRITRRFICDIMGIDDELLQVIFGEALPTEDPADFLYKDNKASKEVEERLLNRLARELGVLVNHYTSHPAGEGAFSTHRENFREYDNDDGIQTPQPRSTLREQGQDESTASPRKRQRSQSVATSESSSVPQFQFAPTLAHQEDISHAALWGIEEGHGIDEETQAKRDSQMRKDYWEQELGVRVFFSFLKSRFSGPGSDTSSVPPPPAPIHQSHPLINRSSRSTLSQYRDSPKRPSSPHSASKMVSPSTATSTSAGGQFFGGFGSGIRSMSSYASQSLKGKVNGMNTLSSKGSSRNRGFYWDVATSVGSGKTGSCIGTGVWAAI